MKLKFFLTIMFFFQFNLLANMERRDFFKLIDDVNVHLDYFNEIDSYFERRRVIRDDTREILSCLHSLSLGVSSTYSYKLSRKEAKNIKHVLAGIEKVKYAFWDPAHKEESRVIKLVINLLAVRIEKYRSRCRRMSKIASL